MELVGLDNGHARRRKSIGRKILLTWIMLVVCPGVLALNPSLNISQYAHTTWRVNEGFAKGPILSIAQTPDGYLWQATEFGLLRFDGVRNVPWEPPTDQHLPSNLVHSLFTSRDGTLWIGTNKGLASWNGTTLIQYPEFSGQFVFAVLQDRDGTMWVATSSVPNGELCAIHNGVKCWG